MLEPKHSVRSVTPKHGATWIAKWVSTVLVVLGLAIWQISVPTGPITDTGSILLLLGSLGWWGTGYAWNDRALQLTTGVTSFILIMHLLQSWL